MVRLIVNLLLNFERRYEQSEARKSDEQDWLKDAMLPRLLGCQIDSRFL